MYLAETGVEDGEKNVKEGEMETGVNESGLLHQSVQSNARLN